MKFVYITRIKTSAKRKRGLGMKSPDRFGRQPKENSCMNYLEFLSEVTTIPGTSGYEAPVAGSFVKAFAP